MTVFAAVGSDPFGASSSLQWYGCPCCSMYSCNSFSLFCRVRLDHHDRHVLHNLDGLHALHNHQRKGLFLIWSQQLWVLLFLFLGLLKYCNEIWNSNSRGSFQIANSRLKFGLCSSIKWVLRACSVISSIEP